MRKNLSYKERVPELEKEIEYLNQKNLSLTLENNKHKGSEKAHVVIEGVLVAIIIGLGVSLSAS